MQGKDSEFSAPKTSRSICSTFLENKQCELKTYEGHIEKLVKIEPRADPVRLT